MSDDGHGLPPSLDSGRGSVPPTFDDGASGAASDEILGSGTRVAPVNGAAELVGVE